MRPENGSATPHITRRHLLHGAIALTAAPTAAVPQAGTEQFTPRRPGDKVVCLGLPGWGEGRHILVRFAPLGNLAAGRVGEIISHRWETDRSTHHEYLVELPGAKPGKLLVYYPGYMIYAGELTAEQIAGPQPITLPMNRLPVAYLSGRLLDSADDPVGDKHLALRHTLLGQLDFFQSGGGIINYNHPMDTITLATTQTAADGTFTMKVPVLAEDPFIASHKPDPGTPPESPFSMGLIAPGPNLPRSGFPLEGYLSPCLLVNQKEYQAPVTARWLYPAILKGRIRDSYLKRHGVTRHNPSLILYSGNRFPITLGLTDGKSSFRSLYPRSDGGIIETVKPGTYELRVHYVGTGTEVPSRLLETRTVTLREHEVFELDFA